MRILITPKEIVELCLWDNYERYFIKKKDNFNIETFFNENAEFELNEQECYVIGLSKVVKSSKISTKFNDYMYYIMSNKSMTHDDGTVLVKKNALVEGLDKFKTKFPPAYSPNKIYQKSIDVTFNYIDDMAKKMEKLPIIKVKNDFGISEYYNINAIKKLINPHVE
jgi:hypothetical protein